MQRLPLDHVADAYVLDCESNEDGFLVGLGDAPYLVIFVNLQCNEALAASL